jgi:hypothetical protein
MIWLAWADDPFALDEAIAALRRIALVKAGEQTLAMHRLVQQVLRHQPDSKQHRHRAATALRLISAGFPADHTNPDAWPTYARLLSHALVVRIISSCVVAGRGWPCSACRIRRGLAETKRSVRRYARRASSSCTGWAMPSSGTSPSSTKVTPRGGARWTTGSLTRTRLALA